MNAAVILAAGASERLGQPKQLVEIDGVPLVERAVRAARDAGLVPYVIVGAEAELVSAAVADAVVLRNTDWRSGMGTSVAIGVSRAMTDGAETITVLPCDLPRITHVDLQRLVEASAGFDAAAAAFDGVVGAPACFCQTMFDALVETSPTAGARELLRSGEWRVNEVEIPAANFDVDTPADLAQVRADS